jgi:AcrR family transcriptional regulator
MSRLRQLQRERREQAILDAAASLFGERGYRAVNIDEIAERAEVGVATIYKYFGTKAGLIRELFKPQLERLRAEGEAILAAPAEDPVEGIASLIARYRFGEHWQHRDLFRKIGELDWGYAKVFQGLREKVDTMICSQIRTLVAFYVRRKRIPGSIDPDDVSAILYAIHTFHLQEWALRDDISLEQTRGNIQRQVKLAFRAWTTPPR